MSDGDYMVNKAISNTGPILHLSEIKLINALNIFSKILIPREVASELKKSKVDIPKKIETKDLKSEWKDFVKILTNQKDLDLGEAEAISLTLQEKGDFFLTDDLEARIIAKEYYIEVHGTVGIILRAFREKILDKQNAIEKINALYKDSSLFITNDLVKHIIDEINHFK